MSIMSNLHSKEELNKLYNSRYVDLVMDNDYDAGEPLAKAIKSVFPSAKSVLDVGCNNGVHMSWFIDEGFFVKGVDISEAAWEKAVVPQELITICDLREPLPFNGEFDLAYAIEFMEHIEEEALDQIEKNMRLCTPIFIFTPGNQSGTGHFNMRPVEWWIEKFQGYGWTFLKKESLALHDFLMKPEWDEAQSRFPFMRKGIMAFKSPAAHRTIMEKKF